MNNQTLNTSCSQPEANNLQSPYELSIRGLVCKCSSKILCFFAFLFAATLGIILGAFFSAELLDAIAAVIVAAVILAIIIIALLIYRACFNCRCGC